MQNRGRLNSRLEFLLPSIQKSAVIPIRFVIEHPGIHGNSEEPPPVLHALNPVLQERIQRQPLLEWKALNVRRYKGLP